MTEKALKGGAIKIYGTSTVGVKGQVIIPKETRDDFDLLVGDNLKSLIFDNKFIGLIKDKDAFMKIMIDSHNDGSCTMEIGESVKVGTNFQFVIPHNLRKIIGINSGDIMVFISKSHVFGCFKNDNIDAFLNFIKEDLIIK